MPKNDKLLVLHFNVLFLKLNFILNYIWHSATHGTDRETGRIVNNKIIGYQSRREETQTSCWHKAPNAISEPIRKKQSIKSTKPIDNRPSWVLISIFLTHFPVHDVCLYTSITKSAPKNTIKPFSRILVTSECYSSI